MRDLIRYHRAGTVENTDLPFENEIVITEKQESEEYKARIKSTLRGAGGSALRNNSKSISIEPETVESILNKLRALEERHHLPEKDPDAEETNLGENSSEDKTAREPLPFFDETYLGVRAIDPEDNAGTNQQSEKRKKDLMSDRFEGSEADPDKFYISWEGREPEEDQTEETLKVNREIFEEDYEGDEFTSQDSEEVEWWNVRVSGLPSGKVYDSILGIGGIGISQVRMEPEDWEENLDDFSSLDLTPRSYELFLRLDIEGYAEEFGEFPGQVYRDLSGTDEELDQIYTLLVDDRDLTSTTNPETPDELLDTVRKHRDAFGSGNVRRGTDPRIHSFESFLNSRGLSDRREARHLEFGSTDLYPETIFGLFQNYDLRMINDYITMEEDENLVEEIRGRYE